MDSFFRGRRYAYYYNEQIRNTGYFRCGLSRGRQPTQIKDISRRQKNISTLSGTDFQQAAESRMLKSRRGPRGGYMLSQRCIGDIHRRHHHSCSGSHRAVKCLSADEPRKKDCDIMNGCITRPCLARNSKVADDYYNSVSVADLCLWHARKAFREIWTTSTCTLF